MDNINKKLALKATSIIGGTQFLTIVIGVLRGKVLAILLGPSGFGMYGMFQSIIDLGRNISGFGLNYSAVKDISESVATDDQIKIGETLTVLRKLVIWSGILGVLLTFMFSDLISELTFGTNSYSSHIKFLSIILIVISLSGGQMAILQGKMEITKMAKANLWASILSTMVSIILFYLFGLSSIVPVLIISSFITLFYSWFYTRKIKYNKIKLSNKFIVKAGYGMVKLGFFIVITGFISTLTLYIVRKIILSKLNIESVGFFQASWMINTTYIGIILNAMLADFFPRLSAINNDNNSSNKLINDQIELALILGTPMILGFIAFAPFAIDLLYSKSFNLTVTILRWQLLGSFITLIMWPLGVMFLAKNKGFHSIWTDGLWSILFVGLIYFGWELFNYQILGIAFFVASVIKLICVYFVTNFLGKFTFSREIKVLIFLMGTLMFFMISNVLVFHSNNYSQFYISALILLICIFISARKLKSIFS